MSTKKTYTEKQKIFLEEFARNGFNAKKAQEVAGYSKTNGHQVVKALREEIRELAELTLAENAPKAALALVKALDSDKPIPQLQHRLNAAQGVLDRTGHGKTNNLDVSLNGEEGTIFILPAKNVETNAES